MQFWVLRPNHTGPVHDGIPTHDTAVCTMVPFCRLQREEGGGGGGGRRRSKEGSRRRGGKGGRLKRAGGGQAWFGRVGE